MIEIKTPERICGNPPTIETLDQLRKEKRRRERMLSECRTTHPPPLVLDVDLDIDQGSHPSSRKKRKGIIDDNDIDNDNDSDNDDDDDIMDYDFINVEDSSNYDSDTGWENQSQVVSVSDTVNYESDTDWEQPSQVVSVSDTVNYDDFLMEKKEIEERLKNGNCMECGTTIDPGLNKSIPCEKCPAIFCSDYRCNHYVNNNDRCVLARELSNKHQCNCSVELVHYELYDFANRGFNNQYYKKINECRACF